MFCKSPFSNSQQEDKSQQNIYYALQNPIPKWQNNTNIKMIKTPNKQKISLLKCQRKNKAYFVCINKNCNNKNAIMCQHKDCNCRIFHDTCFSLQIQKVVNELDQNAIQYKKTIYNQARRKIQAGLSQLNWIKYQILQKYEQLFDNKKAYSFEQNIFLSSIQSGSCEKITGSLMYQIISNRKNKDQLYKPIEQMYNQIQEYRYGMIKNINNLGYYLQQSLLKLLNPTICTNFQCSKILNNNSKLISLFQTVPNIQKGQLVYRASQNGFDNQSFNKLCKDNDNLLYLIKTTKYKTIGCYVSISLPYHQRDQNLWLEDKTKKSFLFSFNTYSKPFKKHLQKAIYNCSNDSQYMFGFCDELMISNMSNKNKNSYIRVKDSNTSYQQKSYLKETVRKQEYFKVKEIEVWKVVLGQ